MTEPAGWSRPAMDTLVTIRLTGAVAEPAALVERAFGWFDAVTAVCSRFDPDSEVSRLAIGAGEPVPVSPLLAAALGVALDAAEWTGGAFDPTLGSRLASLGFDREYRTGARVPVVDAPGGLADVHLDPAAGTVTLDRPVLLDLGAVAKGLAVDLAVAELAGLPGATVDAGGDAGLHGGPWRVGVADPRRAGELLTVLELTDVAIATSGGYARHGAGGAAHVFDPRPDAAVPAAGVTVLAPTALAADVLSTAALVLGVELGADLLESTEDVAGLLVGPDGRTHRTSNWKAMCGKEFTP